jgi:hypothetical protein
MMDTDCPSKGALVRTESPKPTSRKERTARKLIVLITSIISCTAPLEHRPAEDVARYTCPRYETISTALTIEAVLVRGNVPAARRISMTRRHAKPTKQQVLVRISLCVEERLSCSGHASISHGILMLPGYPVPVSCQVVVNSVLLLIFPSL